MNFVTRFRVGWICRAVIFVCVLSTVTVNADRCTEVLKKSEVRPVILKVRCQENYQARCGWFSMSFCNFTRYQLCDKPSNQTIVSYYVVTDCCKGFYMAENGSCIRQQPGVIYVKNKDKYGVTEDPSYVESPVTMRPMPSVEKMEISGGGYAGIMCGIVLLMVVIGFILVALHKKKKKKLQKPDPTQQVRYMGRANTPSIVYTTPPSKPASPAAGDAAEAQASLLTRTPSIMKDSSKRTTTNMEKGVLAESPAVDQGQVTFASPRTVTPTSAEVDASETVPLRLHSAIEDENIPESDV